MFLMFWGSGVGGQAANNEIDKKLIEFIHLSSFFMIKTELVHSQVIF